MSDYIEHLWRSAGHLHERAQLLRAQSNVLMKEARCLEHEARRLAVRVVVESLRQFFRRS